MSAAGALIVIFSSKWYGVKFNIKFELYIPIHHKTFHFFFNCSCIKFKGPISMVYEGSGEQHLLVKLNKE
jgi:hypothetical protein